MQPITITCNQTINHQTQLYLQSLCIHLAEVVSDCGLYICKYFLKNSIFTKKLKDIVKSQKFLKDRKFFQKAIEIFKR